MPNHVTTTMQVFGSEEEVTKFKHRHILLHPSVQREDWQGELIFIDGKPAMEPEWIQFDFNTVIPMPEILSKVQSSSRTSDAVEVLTGKSVEEIVAAKNPGDERAQRMLSFKKEIRNNLMPPDVRAEFLTKITAEDLEQGRLALQAIEETGYPTWYEWSIANWGTKWNSYDFREVSTEPKKLVFMFETAWSTPLPVFEQLAAKFPFLRFVADSFDEGWGWAAHGVGVDGGYEENLVEADKDSYEAAYGVPYVPDDDEDVEAEVDESSNDTETEIE